LHVDGNGHRGKLRATASPATVAGVPLESLTGWIDWNDQVMQISRLVLAGPAGRLAGAGTVDWGSGEVELHLDGTALELSAEPLVRFLPRRDLRGTASAAVQVSGQYEQPRIDVEVQVPRLALGEQALLRLAQPIEQPRAFRRRGAADHAAVVLDEAQHERTDPPRRVRRQPDAAFGVEAIECAQEADVALLFEIRDRAPTAPVAARVRSHDELVAEQQTIASDGIPVIPPASGERGFGVGVEARELRGVGHGPLL
jgi:hypothetical protein